MQRYNVIFQTLTTYQDVTAKVCASPADAYAQGRELEQKGCRDVRVRDTQSQEVLGLAAFAAKYKLQ